MRAPGDAGPAPRSTETQDLLAEVTGLRAELERVDRETEALRRTADQARQALRDVQGGVPQTAAAQQAGPPSQPQTAPLQLAIAASPATDEVRRLQQDLAGAQATVAALSADLAAAKGATGVGTASDAAADLAALKEQLGAAHRRAAQLGATLAGEPSEERSEASGRCRTPALAAGAALTGSRST